MDFEQGPIRPPSEAGSLLIRVTRNCPWNKCYFCITYKGKKFSRRTAEEVKADLKNIKNTCEEIQELSRRWGEGGNVTPAVIKRLREDYGPAYLQAALWLYRGGKTVFLQDANSLVLKTGALLEILQAIKEYFPAVERITTYARARTVARKSAEELGQLQEAGLSRVHMGMESGSDRVLTMINKGTSAGDIITAGKKLTRAGISLCFYVILGLGGVDYTREHALETARVVNAVNPDHVRFRTLAVLPETPLAGMVNSGSFHPLHEDDIIREEKMLLENLQGINTEIVSDHALNLLEDVQGKLPEEKEKMLHVINYYLELPQSEKLNFRLGRRGGVYRVTGDMSDPRRYDYVARGLNYLGDEQTIEETIDYLRQRYL